MRYAVVSDVHGNLEALGAVLEDADRAGATVLCLGDIVGYGADPGPCVDLIGSRALVTVVGNHEYAVLGRLDRRWFNAVARTAAVWSEGVLGADRLAWLGTLPLTAEVDDATLVHASPRMPEEWDYLMFAQDGWAALPAFATRLCFIGHTHVPTVWSVGSSGPEWDTGNIDVTLEPGRRYLVNVGSVGQPRDHDARASYALWDSDERRVRIVRVAYDVETARRKIIDAGLPRVLGDRLVVGR